MDEPYVHRIFNKGKHLEKAFLLSGVGFSDDHIKDEAIFTYPIKHYTSWNEDNSVNISVGEMSENFSVLEMDEFTVCIGDTFKMGEAIIQVSRPGKVKTKKIKESLQTGWYFRVLKEGTIEEGTDLERLDRPYPYWSIAACNEIMYINKHDLRMADDLSECELLSVNWRRALRKRVRGF